MESATTQELGNAFVFLDTSRVRKNLVTHACLPVSSSISCLRITTGLSGFAELLVILVDRQRVSVFVYEAMRRQVASIGKGAFLMPL